MNQEQQDKMFEKAIVMLYVGCICGHAKYDHYRDWHSNNNYGNSGCNFCDCKQFEED